MLLVGRLIVATCSAAARPSRHARQLRRAATSVPLNLAEGYSLEGGNRRLRYPTALGSAREVRACFEVAFAMHYIEALALDDADRLDKVIATLVKLCRRSDDASRC